MKRIMFLVNRDFVLYNFRFELVQRLLEEKYEVYICLPYGEKVEPMVQAGCKFIRVEIDKRGTNPIRDIALIRDYYEIFRQYRPDMILTYTTKVCIYAGIVAGRMKIPYLMNVSGLGTALENPGLLQPVMIWLYRKAAKRADCVFFQNRENLEFFQNHKIRVRKYKLIPGSGVNLDKWKYLEYPDDKNGVEFLFIARIIKEKGIEEYLACAKAIKKEYPDAIFHVVGPCDGPYKEILSENEKQGIICYHGEVSNTAEYLQKVHCLIHPSYYPEGMSNVCLEAAASGRPVITTDRSGCGETVEDGVTGYIFEQRNTENLVKTVERFMGLKNGERKRMGIVGREKMVREFNRNIVIDLYFEETKCP